MRPSVSIHEKLLPRILSVYNLVKSELGWRKDIESLVIRPCGPCFYGILTGSWELCRVTSTGVGTPKERSPPTGLCSARWITWEGMVGLWAWVEGSGSWSCLGSPLLGAQSLRKITDVGSQGSCAPQARRHSFCLFQGCERKWMMIQEIDKDQNVGKRMCGRPKIFVWNLGLGDKAHLASRMSLCAQNPYAKLASQVSSNHLPLD